MVCDCLFSRDLAWDIESIPTYWVDQLVENESFNIHKENEKYFKKVLTKKKPNEYRLYLTPTYNPLPFASKFFLNLHVRTEEGFALRKFTFHHNYLEGTDYLRDENSMKFYMLNDAIKAHFPQVQIPKFPPLKP